MQFNKDDMVVTYTGEVGRVTRTTNPDVDSVVVEFKNVFRGCDPSTLKIAPTHYEKVPTIEDIQEASGAVTLTTSLDTELGGFKRRITDSQGRNWIVEGELEC